MFRAIAVATILLAVAVQSAPDQGNSAFITVQNAYRRAYSSGGSGNTGSGTTGGSGYSSGGSGTTGGGAAGGGGGGAVTRTTPITIKQKVTFDLTSAAAYTGNLKTVCEVGVSIVYGIYLVASTAFAPGCSMASAVVTRRADVEVEFTATVSAAKATAADANSKAMTTAALTTALGQAKTATGHTGVTLPTVKSIKAPTITANTVSGVSSTSSMCMYTLVASAVALLYRH